MEVGANWVHFSNMRPTNVNPVEKLVLSSGLNYVEDNYEDIIFRYRGGIIKPWNKNIDMLISGKNVTEEYHGVWTRLDEAKKVAVKIAERKLEKNEPDINFRSALALADWRPRHALEKAAEWFDFDFEFGDEPEDTSLKCNFEVAAGDCEGHLCNDKHTVSRPSVDEPRTTCSLLTREDSLR